MGLFDRFKRKQRVVLPEEVQSYYQSERRERVVVAIVLGIVALLATLLIAAGLFFGGRYVYRQITGNESQTQPAGDVEVRPESIDTPSDQQPSSDPAPAPTPSNNNTSQGSVNAPPSPAPAPAPSTTMPSLGDSALPRTGDEGR